ncbi:hypothetical protein FFI89_027960 [Bradyrhizobium sp. KBS0727]|uniref:hypothetical protein n=1 Tax=unclassified Bradyrhizobium TaxID=2631580 RepID=UPI00110E7334|nr:MULTISPECIES: hypothetical protein [unclassified Bradyrhizobium]QDW40627.1 hypothetical protein FFI71_027965 [Bradyrhizobium sp. KBS0725]QDW47232.1 hypothetical protein FFI89_027960 [Bradyrhizobium sp. KBS0727]
MKRFSVLLFMGALSSSISCVAFAAEGPDRRLNRDVWRGIFEYTTFNDKMSQYKIIALARSPISGAGIVGRADQAGQSSNRISVPARSLLTKVFKKCMEANKLPSSSIPADSSISDTINGLRGGTVAGGGLWGPQLLRVRGTALEPKHDFVAQCMSADVGLPTFFVTFADFTNVSDPAVVYTELANEFARIGLMRKNPKKWVGDIKRVYAERDIPISEGEAVRELLNGLPPPFEDQLARFDNANGPAEVETTLSGIIDEMADVGIINVKPRAADLFDASALKAIASDPRLRKIATSND